MRRTSRRRASGALLAVASLLASCGSDDSTDPTPGTPTFLEGDWTSCTTETIAPYGTHDVRANLSFSGDRYQYDAVLYGTSANGTCAGTGFVIPDVSGSGTFTVGSEVQATLDAAAVTARAIDLLERRGQQTTRLYTIAYLDTAPAPDVLYANLTAMGTTPETRPTTLESSRPFRRIP